MIVILDSNIICSDFKMKGNNFKMLFDYIERGQAKLGVPTIVLNEVKNKYSEEFKETKDAIDNKLNHLARRVGGLEAINPISDSVIVNEADKYSRWLDQKLKELNPIILTYPEVKHETIITRALHRKKPFKSNGDGYRDTLIWETVLSVVSKYKNIIFITRNTEDFCTKGSSSTLHEDLIEDLKQKTLKETNLFFFVDIKAFLIELVLPNFSKQEELQQKITERKYPFDGLNQVLKEKIKSVLRDSNSELNDLYFEDEFENIKLLGIDEDPKLDVSDVRKLNENEAYVSLEVRTFASYSGMVKLCYINKINDCFNYWVSEFNSRYFEAIKIKGLSIKLNLIYSNVSCNVTNVEIESIEEF